MIVKIIICITKIDLIAFFIFQSSNFVSYFKINPL